MALVAQEPDAPALTRVLADLDPALLLGRYQETGVLQVRDAAGHLLVTIEPGQRVEARGEVGRLLGNEATTGLPDPCWWLELRARPDAPGRDAAHRIADALALRLGGLVWTSLPDGSTGDADVWEETAHPTVERAARHAVVVAQDRAVVGFSSWLNDAVGVHGARRAIQVLTPATSRLTYALRTFLAGPLGRWVVRDGDGTHFDGLTGLALRWDEAYGFVPERADLNGLEEELRNARERGEHAPVLRPGTGAAEESDGPEAVPGFLSTDPMETQLIIELSVLHRDASKARVGRAVEILTGRLAGAVPAGWGPHEPALTAWDRKRIAGFVRERSRRRTLVHVSGPHGVGHPFAGSLRVERRGDRVGEQVSLAIGFTEEGDVPFDALPELVGTLAAEGLLEGLQVRRVRGRSDRGLTLDLGHAEPDRCREEARIRAWPARPTPRSSASRRSTSTSTPRYSSCRSVLS